ncbi:SPOR domain-containing protein [Tabrizicola sp.]|uniref:SPOR domain-containing protein n=1 Tax=Tabrizicola sp. TaxID=2005166 RepID=UPI003F41006F
MARAVVRGIVFGLATTGLLVGCVDGSGTGGSAEGPGLAAPASKKAGGNREVEAPEVFQATDSALWDGRPSLGGIWVASPEVTNPERVVMFNPATGKSVNGALFRRERENPGPRLQLSSDAAEALGILAGQPTEIQVTAVRKEEVEEPAAAEEATAAADTDPAAEPAADGDAAAIASAALDAVDAGAAAPAADAAAVAAEGTDAAAAAALAAGTALAVDEKPKRKTWKERRAEAKAAREAKKKAAAEAKAAEEAAAAGIMVEGEAPTATADTAGVAAIESAPLDARSAEPATEASGNEPAKATAAAEPEVPPTAAAGARPIQVASFSKEDNAKRAAEALAKIGITATPQKSERNGKAVWGVVVMGDDAMLKKIKDAGFADAYFLT